MMDYSYHFQDPDLTMYHGLYQSDLHAGLDKAYEFLTYDLDGTCVYDGFDDVWFEPLEIPYDDRPNAILEVASEGNLWAPTEDASEIVFLPFWRIYSYVNDYGKPIGRPILIMTSSFEDEELTCFKIDVMVDAVARLKKWSWRFHRTVNLGNNLPGNANL